MQLWRSMRMHPAALGYRTLVPADTASASPWMVSLADGPNKEGCHPQGTQGCEEEPSKGHEDTSKG